MEEVVVEVALDEKWLMTGDGRKGGVDVLGPHAAHLRTQTVGPTCTCSPHLSRWVLAQRVACLVAELGVIAEPPPPLTYLEHLRNPPLRRSSLA